MVLHSNQLEGLRELMIEFMRHNPLSPLQPEVLLVQSNGMKHWLEMTLAHELGICAATHIELPSSALWKIYRHVLGADVVPAEMPLDKAPLTWRIMRRLPMLLKDDAFVPLQRYLQDEQGQPQIRRLYQLAQQIADVFDGYQNYRADWLTQWASGNDEVLPAEQRWQAHLWRDVLNDLSQDHLPSKFQSRAQVHEAFLDKLAQLKLHQRPAGVPERLMVFGVTSLPMQTLEALAALGRISQVFMWVQNPCQHHWGHVVESHRPLAALAQRRQANKKDIPAPTNTIDASAQFLLHTQTNPLLAAWGKQGRDYLHLLDDFDDVHLYQEQFKRVDLFIDPVKIAFDENKKPTQLQWLQSDILNLEPAPNPPRTLAQQDQSIQFIQTHSAQREVEVLHDQLLYWLDNDVNLQASDIMVMVPDMSTFAPHIHAVFGREQNPLPYSVADTTPSTEPLVQALETLLQLPQLRITRSEWLGLFEVTALRQRFGLQEADVETINTWLEVAGVRWGLDAQHRTQWGLRVEIDHADQNTWLFGLERLLLGYAQKDTQGIWQQIAPAVGIDGLDADLFDGLIQWLHQVQIYAQLLQQSHTPAHWVEVLQQLVMSFFKAQTDAQERLMERVLSPLEQWLKECQLARMNEPLPLAVARDHWLSQLKQPVSHQRFFGGGVQFATLMPMRSIPFKIVCLLGMNEADYPRRTIPIDFDLMRDANKWRPGDRSRRDDDRYLFLEAVLSAREKLYISWQGKRTNDHQDLPPCVLVAQLIDYLRLGWIEKTEALLQPLQAFSPQYFDASRPFFTYASEWQSVRNKTLSTASPTTHQQIATNIELSQLSRLMQQPVNVYFQDHLNVRLSTPQTDVQDHEPFALDHLENFKLTQILALETDEYQALESIRSNGQLALAQLGQQQINQLLQQSQTLKERMTHWLTADQSNLQTQSFQLSVQRDNSSYTLQAQWPQEHQLWKIQADGKQWLQVDIRAGAIVQGKDSAPQPRGSTLCDVWLNHLVACASGNPTTSVQIGLKGEIMFSPLAKHEATQMLEQLIDIYIQAWREPLPVARDTACAYLVSIHYNNKNPELDAQQTFEGTHQRLGEWEKYTLLQRVFRNYSDISPTLAIWAEAIYGNMIRAAKVITHAKEMA